MTRFPDGTGAYRLYRYGRSFWYLDSANFLDKNLFAGTLNELENDLKKNWLGKQSKRILRPGNVVAHPAWEIVEAVSSGKLSKVFSNLKKVKFIDKVGCRLGFGKFCIARALSSNRDLHDSFVRQMKNLQKRFPSSILIGLGFGDMDKL